MKIKKLIEFLDSGMDKRLFIDSLSKEVKEYSLLRNSDSSNIYVVDLENEIDFKDEYLINLLALYLEEEIKGIELEYLMNVLDFSSLNFSEKASSIISELSNPELNNSINKEYVINCISGLGRHYPNYN